MKTFTETEQKTASKAVANNVSTVKPTPLKTPALQTQLKIGQPNDKYEQEADRIADQVMSMPESSIQQQPLEEEEEMVQTQPLEEEEELLQTKPFLQLQPIEEEEEEELMPKLQLQPVEEEEEMLQTKPLLQLQPEEEEEEMLQPKWIQKEGCSSCGEKEMPDLQGSMPRIQMSPLSHIESCGGQPLPDSSRGFFESRLGYNFNNVRVHTCDSAVQMNQQLGAQAFTYGNNVFFNKGKYNPGSTTGKHLIAHELTHVIQQNGGLKKLDKKRQFFIQPYRQKNNNINHNISSASKSIQRLPVVAALAIACAIGAIVGMLLDWGIMYAYSRIRGREYRHDWCGTILAGILGCLGGISAAGVEIYMLRTGARLIVGGPIIGRILSWLVAQTSVFFPRQAALSLLRMGCINEEQHESITE